MRKLSWLAVAILPVFIMALMGHAALADSDKYYSGQAMNVTLVTQEQVESIQSINTRIMSSRGGVTPIGGGRQQTIDPSLVEGQEQPETVPTNQVNFDDGAVSINYTLYKYIDNYVPEDILVDNVTIVLENRTLENGSIICWNSTQIDQVTETVIVNEANIDNSMQELFATYNETAFNGSYEMGLNAYEPGSWNRYTYVIESSQPISYSHGSYYAGNSSEKYAFDFKGICRTWQQENGTHEETVTDDFWAGLLRLITFGLEPGYNITVTDYITNSTQCQAVQGSPNSLNLTFYSDGRIDPYMYKKFLGANYNLSAVFVPPSPPDKSWTENATTNVSLRISTANNQGAETYTFLTDGLVGWWRMGDDNDMDGNLIDMSGNGNTGTLVNSPTQVEGKFGQAMSFDGSNRVSIPGISLSSTNTISFWVNLTIPVTYGFIVGQHNCPWTSVMLSDSDLALWDGDWKLFGISLATGKWTHVTLVNTAGTVQAYINGVAAGSTVSNSGLNIDSIGGDIGGDNLYGSIDDVLIFNRSLSDSEVMALYNSSQYNLQKNYTSLTGPQKFTAFSVDTIGNLNSTSLYYNINTNGPSPSFIPPTPSEGSSSSSAYTLNVTTNNSLFEQNGSGLVGWLTMDEATGATVIDHSGNGNDGTPHNSPASVPGKIGQALSFNGSSQYVDAGNGTSLNITGNLTISVWVKRTDTPEQYGGIVAKDNTDDGVGYSIGQFSATVPAFKTRTGTTWNELQFAEFPLNTWRHVVATYDGSTKKVYLDGVFAVSASVSGSISTNSYTLKIGRSDTGTFNYFSGSIDDVRIYNRALTAGEVRNLYQESPHSYTFFKDGLVGWWRMGDVQEANIITQTGPIPVINVFDESGNNNDGLLFGSPATGAGAFGQDTTFSGSNQYMSIDHSASLDVPSGYTLSAWINPVNNVSLYNPILIKNARISNPNADDIEMYLSDASSGLVLLHNRGNGGTLEYATNNAHSNVDNNGAWGSPPSGTWTLVTAVYNQSGGTWKVYFNGTQQGNTVTGVNDPDNNYNSNWFAGAALSNGFYGYQQYFQGSMDDILIFNRSLSDSEVMALYNSSQQDLNRSFTGIAAGQQNYTAIAVNSYANVNITQRGFSVSAGGDTCTPPSPGSNWNVLCSDNCRLASITSLGAGNLTLSSNGIFTLAAKLFVNNLLWNKAASSFCKFIGFDKLVVQ